ncbi:MAG TPA: hypothetical protein VFU71_20585, partial [Burkholderiaceae bacterium]|nr:hypothetical protein [Burkholderiaceae bacterium]
MTTTITTNSASTSGIASMPHDDTLDAAANAPEHAGPATTDGAHPLAKFGPNDLHQLVQPYVGLALGRDGDAPLLAFRAPTDSAPGAQGPSGGPTPLHDDQVPGATRTQETPAPKPAVPSAPMDVRQVEVLNRTVQAYNVARSPVDASDLRDAQRHFQAATDALKAGDYKKAEQELRQLGFPLPPPGSRLSQEGSITAILLGVPVHARKGGGWQMDPVKWSAHGNQALNDVNGYTANAIMINRMASAPGGVSNPPTEAQVTGYMRDLGHPSRGKPPTAQDMMQAASEITGGMIMHYSSAGHRDPVYGDNPSPHVFYKDPQGQIHEFPSMADAQKAARAGQPPIDSSRTITTLHARSPDEWRDIQSQGTRAGRYIGDCESKVYLQTRLLSEAGFKSLGSVDVQHGTSGHMFGVFKAPDGTVWVTSNEEFRQVRPSDAKKGVTQADLDDTLKQMTAELY